jgi:hypothetical protein
MEAVFIHPAFEIAEGIGVAPQDLVVSYRSVMSSSNPGSSLDFALTLLYGRSDTVYGDHTRNRGKR